MTRRDALLAVAVVYASLSPFFSAVVPATSWFRVLLAALIALMVWRDRRRLTPWRQARLMPLLALFASSLIIPMMLVGLSVYSLVRYVNWVMFLPAALLVLTPRMRRSLLIAGLGGFGLLMLGVLLQNAGVLGGIWGGLRINPNESDLSQIRLVRRYTSFLQNPNDFGLYCALVAAGFLSWARSARRNHWDIVLRVVGFSAALVGVALSGSRGAWLALALICVVLVVGTARSMGGLMRTAALVGGLLLAASVSSSQEISQEIRTTLASLPAIAAGQDASANSRYELWSRYWEELGVNPLGVGFGGHAQPEIPLADRREKYRVTTLDNTFMKAWVEGGLLVLGAFTLLLGTVGRRLIVLWGSGSRHSHLAVLTAIQLGIVSRAFSVDILDIMPWNLFYWLSTAAVISLWEERTSRDFAR